LLQLGWVNSLSRPDKRQFGVQLTGTLKATLIDQGHE
jgi:hypothetical protein